VISRRSLQLIRLVTSQRPHHLYSLLKINKWWYYCYLISNNIKRGIRRILTAAYFSATKTGKLAPLHTYKNCKLLILIFYYIVYLKNNNTSCLDKTIIHVDTILYLSLYYLVNDLLHLPNPTITCQLTYFYWHDN